jgi:tetratricopeptide (TPR) repeat protein
LSYVQADLQNAKQSFQNAIDKAGQLQLRSRLAWAVAGMGDVMLAEDDLQGANRSYQQSLTIRTELGEKGGVAQSQLSLAELALENGQAAQAESLAREAASEFEKENDSDQRTAAEDVLARSLMAQEKYDEAARELAIAQKLGARDIPTTLSLSVTRAMLLGKTAKTTEAERELQKVETRSAEKGLLVFQWKARLALADVQTLSGQLASARSNLELVKRQAAPKGFRFFARKAADAEASPRHRG